MRFRWPFKGLSDRGVMISTAVIVLLLFSGALNDQVRAADVLVHDEATSVDRKVTLRAVTRGRFFPQGGKLVTFSIDGKELRRTLSGGDGFAFAAHVPTSSGLKNLEARSNGAEDRGVLLVTDKRDRVLMVAVEGILFATPFSPASTQGGLKELQDLSERYPIIYFTSLLGTRKSRQWLREKGYPSSPVLQWKGPDSFSYLLTQEVPLYAIVAPPDMLQAAPADLKKFSFSETGEAVVVDSWDDIISQLR